MTLPFSAFSGRHLAGRKTITIRDAAESHLSPAMCCALGAMKMTAICTIAVTATSTVTLDTLTEQHAQQENMTLRQLRQVISDIYHGESQFYVIEFKTL
ncbi:ASCH domain-containing protein [Klebsiella pneumoniae]|uniref:ASCH domain-containing protein n=1 Tax=Klebsiella pneumoniae TaxID=573 RepID=A0A939NNV1_KLEPN|nr:ASCH domain-containing protein [Klebsiella pneumoniae]